MIEPNFSIDVSLLAIILGLYATRNDRNLILILICVLFAHVSLTTNDTGFGDDSSIERENAVADAETHGSVSIVADETSQAETTDVRAGLGSAPAHKTNGVEDSFKTTVSSGVFDRQLSTPQTNLTDTIFPSTSVEANGKLASARGSFFKSLVS
jgi:hypothetical protein